MTIREEDESLLRTTWRAKEGHDPIKEVSVGVHLAFPDDEDTPSRADQRFLGLGISTNIGVELGAPIILATFGEGGSSTAIMAVPEATMDEDNASPFGENDVGTARKTRKMQTVAVTESMQATAD